MSSFLLEIGLEEVPARFMNACLNDLKSLILKNLTSHRLVSNQTTLQSYGIYRRFIIKVDHLLDKKMILISKGWSTSGNSKIELVLVAAEIGFLKMNANPDDLIEVENKKGQSILALQQLLCG